MLDKYRRSQYSKFEQKTAKHKSDDKRGNTNHEEREDEMLNEKCNPSHIQTDPNRTRIIFIQDNVAFLLACSLSHRNQSEQTLLQPSNRFPQVKLPLQVYVYLAQYYFTLGDKDLSPHRITRTTFYLESIHSCI
jgi:hypothetical protein